ncbi:MAG TPA: ATP-binding protein [Methylomirabilota bacterium]|jgi:signal transduction histidine kinase
MSEDGRRATATWIAVVTAGLLGLTAALASVESAETSLIREVYAVPVLAAALRFGLPGGIVASGAAIVLQAPFVLPPIERTPAAALPAVAGFTVVAVVGIPAGLLTTRVRRRHARYETLLAVQRILGGQPCLDTALKRLCASLQRRLGAVAVALVVRDGNAVTIGGGRTMAPGSPLHVVCETGRPLFIADAGAECRPRRLFAAPLGVGERAGALAVERWGDIDTDEREAIVALAVHVGLALENARLAARQRRFADELAHKVAAATERLEEADRAKSTFVAVTSHELRTPLTALLGFSELLWLRRYPTEEVQRLAAIMHVEIARLVRIVSDVLDLSRVERGAPLPLRRSALAVEPAVAAAVALFRVQTPVREIVLDCAPDLPAVDADGDAFDRIVKNLVSNALKYSAPNGVVRVCARAAPGAVEFTVEDSGRGIPEIARRRVFEPYYRAPDAVGAARGEGIGLAVVKALVDAHGGAVTVASTPGIGTRVTFVLPAVS